AIKLNETVDNLFMNPFVRINQIALQLNTTYPTAKKLVNRLEDLKILKEVANRERNKLFVAHEILEIITV
ncbi:MAG: Fic family protein, partial [archaeon]|nr:Fic family protein [archaeon]